MCEIFANYAREHATMHLRGLISSSRSGLWTDAHMAMQIHLSSDSGDPNIELRTRPESEPRRQYCGNTILPLSRRRYGGVLQRFVRTLFRFCACHGS